jgi:hypothetical protein
MSETKPKAKTPATIRIPPDVLTAAKAQAEAEHRTFTDAMVRLARAYGDKDPAALAIVAGVSPAVIELHMSTVRPVERKRATKDAVPVAASSKAECPPHPKNRVHRGLCSACHRNVGDEKVA